MTASEAVAYKALCPAPVELTTPDDDHDGLAQFSAIQRLQYVTCAKAEHGLADRASLVPELPAVVPVKP